MSVARQIKRQAFSQEMIVELWSFDTSRLTDDPAGTTVYRLVSGSTREDNPVSVGGVPFEPRPIHASGFGGERTKSPQRPQVSMGNLDGAIAKWLAYTNNQWNGSTVRRDRIHRSHLDQGSDPNPLKLWQPELYTVNRKLRHNRRIVAFELAALPDQIIDAPTRMISSDSCPWSYLSIECNWIRGREGLLFNARNEIVVDPAEDDCSRTPEGCRLRFGGLGTREPRRFGGFAGLARPQR